MFGSITLKALSSFFASILSFTLLSSASLSPTPSILVMDKNQISAIKEFHNLELQVAALKIETEFGRVLKRGLTGSDVKQLQQYLNKLTLSFPAAYISSLFGPTTEKTIKQFQIGHSLNATGVFDSQTRDTLAEFIASSSFNPTSADANFPDLNSFLSAVPSSVVNTTPVPSSSVTASDSIPFANLDSACLDNGYLSPDNAVTLDQLDSTCTSLGYILPSGDNGSSCNTPTPTPTPTPTKTPTPSPTPTPISQSASVQNLTGSCPSLTFKLGTATWNTNASTSFSGMHCSDMRNGLNISATGTTQSNGHVLATQITKV